MNDKPFSNHLSSFMSTRPARREPQQELPSKRSFSSLSSKEDDTHERRDNKRALTERVPSSVSDDVSELESESESESDELHSLDDEGEANLKDAFKSSPSSISDQRVCDGHNIKLIVSLPNLRIEDFDFPLGDRAKEILPVAQTQSERDRERQQQRTKEIEMEIARATAAQQQRRMQQKKQLVRSPLQGKREGREALALTKILTQEVRMGKEEDGDDDSERVIFAFPKASERKRPQHHNQTQEGKEKREQVQLQVQEQEQDRNQEPSEQMKHEKGEEEKEETTVLKQQEEREENENAVEENGVVMSMEVKRIS